MTAIRHVFFDIGGVLATNGWDREQRKVAVEKFGLSEAEFQSRHEEMVGPLEQGQISLDEYLDIAVFYEPREFTREEFREFIFAQSQPYEGSIAIARAVAEGCRYWVMTMNNEGEDLNRHRICTFGLDEFCDAFLSSCWLGLRKPAQQFYRRALGISEARPNESVFIDDRPQNLAPAKALGIRTIHYQNPAQLASELRSLGVQFNLKETSA
ncbi:MAG TPA: HAD family phosphatase [Gemmatimonadaceae bacterium]|jgi:putative hydrolase of the HAD superfamily|nr:HAD family phosphatase [Gemmatimonadaceae bacterium]